MPIHGFDQHAEDGMNKNSKAMLDTMQAYFSWNLGLFPIEKNKSILELGCGPGLYFAELMRYEPSSYVATDYSPSMVAQMLKLMGGQKHFEAFQLDLMDEDAGIVLAGKKFDYCLCFDVLEHIEDDRRAIENIRRLMLRTQTDHLFLKVPSLQCLYGDNDRAIGHFRRYSSGGLRRLLADCGFRVHHMGYQNVAGILPWFVVGKLAKRKLAVSKNEASIFGKVVPLLRSAERLLPPPFGLSLYGVMSPIA